MKNPIGWLYAFLKEVRIELRRVNWPTRPEATRYTIFVLVFSAAIAGLLGFLDFVYIALIRTVVLR